jgi:hypothetical protein
LFMALGMYSASELQRFHQREKLKVRKLESRIEELKTQLESTKGKVDYYLKEAVRAEYSAPPSRVSTPPRASTPPIHQYQLNQQPHALKCVFHLGPDHKPTSCSVRNSPLRSAPAPKKTPSPPRKEDSPPHTIFTAAPKWTQRQLKNSHQRRRGYKGKWRLKNKGGLAVPVPPKGWKSGRREVKHYALLGRDWDKDGW